jgi:ParB family transcriptional regulator, chromosome partitioning protein
MENNSNKTSYFIKPDALKNLVNRYGYKDVVKKIEGDSSVSQTIKVDLNSLELFPLLSEDNYPSSSLKLIEKSISKDGFIVPIIIYKFNDKLTVINGVKRFLVAKSKNINPIPCIQINASEDEIIYYILNNMISNDDNPLVIAYAYNSLITKFNMTEKDVQKITNLSHGQINNTIRLLMLSPKVKQLILNNKLTAAKARLLGRLSSNEQDVLSIKILDLSVREAEEYIRNFKNMDQDKREEISSSFTYQVNDNQIIIDCYNKDYVNKIINMLKEVK